VLQLVV